VKHPSQECLIPNCFDCQRAALLNAQECLEFLGERLAAWNTRLKDWPKYVPSGCTEFYALEVIKAIYNFHQNSMRYLNSLSNEQRHRAP
jgi:hypothetical protein